MPLAQSILPVRLRKRSTSIDLRNTFKFYHRPATNCAVITTGVSTICVSKWDKDVGWFKVTSLSHPLTQMVLTPF